MAEFKNAHYVNAEHTAINIELNHPKWGWIPFTATEADYPEIWAAVVASGPAPYQPPAGDA